MRYQYFDDMMTKKVRELIGWVREITSYVVPVTSDERLFVALDLVAGAGDTPEVVHPDGVSDRPPGR